MKLILASASPRRAELVKKLEGWDVVVRPSFAKEAEEAGSPEETAALNARLKAEEVASRFPNETVLGADTIVTIDGRILGKPKTEADAFNMLKMLSGRTHAVITALCVINHGKKIENHEKTLVTFSAFDENLVYNYIKSGSPFDKAGGYGIQDEAFSPLVKAVDGDIDNVIGLPVGLLRKMLS